MHKQVNNWALRAAGLPDNLRRGRAVATLAAVVSCDRESRINSVLDVGAGSCDHAQYFADQGARVVAVDLRELPHGKKIEFMRGDFMHIAGVGVFDLVWCSHTLEHQRNAGAFIDKLLVNVKPEGLLAITVPQCRWGLASGHLMMWTVGLLAYHIVLAGIDCSDALFIEHGSEICAVIRKRPITLPPLAMDAGDLEILRPYLPSYCVEGFDR